MSLAIKLLTMLSHSSKMSSKKKLKARKIRKSLTTKKKTTKKSTKKSTKKYSSSSGNSGSSSGSTGSTADSSTTDSTTTTDSTVSDTSTSNTQQKVDNTEENEKLARAKFSEGLRDLMSFEIEFQGFIPQLHTNMFIWFELPEKHVLANYAHMVAGIDKTTTRGGSYVLNRYYVEKVTRTFDEGSMVTKVTLNPFASNLSSYYKLYTDAIKAYDQANCSSSSTGSTDSGTGTSATTSETITVTGKPSTKEASKYYQYKDYTKTWKNLCMSSTCKGQHPGTLKDNPKGVYEHEISCSKCDSDYDVTTGADKSGSYRFYLQDANGKSNSHGNIDTSIGGGSDGSTSGATSSTGASSANCVNSSSSSVYNGNVSTDVATAAKQITSATGIQAAQDLANWNSAHITWEGPSGFYQSPSTTLKRKRANCCCKTELLLDMCNVMGVSGLVYVHVSAGAGRGHVFAKIQGTIVDPTKKSNPWGNWVHGYGNLPGVQTNYPKKPFAQTY